MSDGTCSIEGCPEPHSGRGFCGSHYQRWYRYGDPLGKYERIETCTFSGCDKPHESNGYCNAHAKQLRSGVELHPLRPTYRGQLCSIEDCPEQAKARGWCHVHYTRWSKHGDPHVVKPQRGPGIRKYSLNETYFDSIDDEEHAYWLGFISADAGIYHEPNRYGFNLDLAGIDEPHLHRLNLTLGSDRPLRDARRGCIRLAVDSEHMAKALIALGVTPRKSFTLQPWDGPASLMRHYWRGYFDGNGSISKVGGRPHWSLSICGSHAAVDSFAAWARTESGSRAKVGPRKSVWGFAVIGCRMPQRLAVALYDHSSISLPRKLERATRLMAITFDR